MSQGPRFSPSKTRCHGSNKPLRRVCWQAEPCFLMEWQVFSQRRKDRIAGLQT